METELQQQSNTISSSFKKDKISITLNNKKCLLLFSFVKIKTFSQKYIMNNIH